MKNFINYQDKIFIAGSTGMAGSSICRSLMRSNYGNEAYGGKLLTPNRKKLDLSNNDEVNEWFELNKPSVVILAAAKVGGILANSKFPVDFLMENLKIQNNVIEAAFKNGVRRLLFLGSSCIYPKAVRQPIKEEYLLTGSLEGTNEWYAIAKICGLKICESLRIQYGFDAISLMPTNLYGPKDNYHPENSHVMASLIRKFSYATKNNLTSVTCWGTGSPMREFMHVEDLGRAVVFALEKWDPNSPSAPKDNYGKPLYFLNVGTGRDISIYDLALKIAKFTDFKGDIVWDDNKPDGTPRKLLDVSRIQSLGWSPKIELNKGIEDTINLFKKEFF